MEKQLIPKLRFPKYSDEWNKDELKKITSYVDYRGRAPKKSEKGHFLVTAKNIKKGFIDYEISKEFVAIEDYSTVMSKGLPNLGDVLFTTEAPMGNVAQINNESIALAQRVIKFRGEITIQNTFLLYYMLSNVFQKIIKKKAIGTTVQGISGKELHKTIIKYPLIEEQQKIAAFLKDIDDKITKLKKKKNLLEQYKKGVTKKIFNQELRFKDENGNAFPKWVEKKLGVLSSLITKGTTPTSLGFSYLKEGVNFVKVESINKTGFIDIQSTPKVSQECNIALKRSELKVNDILFSIAGTLGRTALVKEKDLPANTNQALAIIRLKSGVNLSFINYSLNTSNIENYILKMVSVGAQPNLNLQQVGDIIIKLPSLKEQTKIANFLSDIDVKIEALNIKIENSKSFKKGLLQQMFV